MLHQSQLIVGEGSPGIVNRDGTGRFPADRVALVHGDAVEFVAVEFESVEL